ncbi:hypothetical protein [Chitinibacter tainanensis]|uniref:hypothetical protein n=1 Tax=Chitinibacter tainanensis TaxID=230667 RepID=UPI0012ECA95D|nr:hypothetical protein [Chitinibacter tainanensis]
MPVQIIINATSDTPFKVTGLPSGATHIKPLIVFPEGKSDNPAIGYYIAGRAKGAVAYRLNGEHREAVAEVVFSQ